MMLCGVAAICQNACLNLKSTQAVISPSAMDLLCSHVVQDRFCWLSAFNICMWNGEKSEAQCRFDLVSVRLLSESYQGCYRTPTSSGRRCKEQGSLPPTFDIYTEFCRELLNLKSARKENLRYNLRQTSFLLVFQFPWVSVLPCQNFESPLSFCTSLYPGCNFYIVLTSLIGQSMKEGFLSLADQYLQNFTLILTV
jgi:hypothetical protein